MIPKDRPETILIQGETVAAGAGADARDAHLPGGKPGQRRPPAGRGAMRAGHGADLEAGARRARQLAGLACRAGRQHQPRRATLLRGQDQPARRREIIGFEAPDLPHNGGDGLALQRLFHRPEAVGTAGGVDDDETRGVDAMGGQARRIRDAGLRLGMVFEHPHDGRGMIQRGGEAGGESQRETAGGGRIAGARRDDLVQRPAPEAAFQRLVEPGVLAQRDAARPGGRGKSRRCAASITLDMSDGRTQNADLFRPAAARHRVHSMPIVPYLFL